MTQVSPTALNWKEIAILADLMRGEVEGLFVDRVIVPERSRFPTGYLKGEWLLRLTGRRSEGSFIFSVRTRRAYFSFVTGKTAQAKAAPQGTRSAFDLELAKLLKGAKLVSLETLPKERTLILWFTNSTQPNFLGLVLNLIPSTPEALLIQGSPPAAGKSTPFSIVTRSRTSRIADNAQGFIPPDGMKAPEHLEVRASLLGAKSTLAYQKELEADLENEAFSSRLSLAQKELRELKKQCQDRMRQTETTLKEALGDENWQRYGDLLKSVLHENPPLEKSGKTWIRRVKDFEQEGEILLPSDPKLSPSQQVEKYYQLARRRARRISEATERLQSLVEAKARFDELLETPPLAGDFKAIEALERAASGASAPNSNTPGKKAEKRKGLWLGKTFTSKDHLTILVGRSRDENLELTFKHARGNDIWLHVRGRPGAHVLILLQPGKSAPLDTLLDAASLAVYYSGGESWGKTEVDYTFKKYVKRIKDSTEASYIKNKTLIVEQDAARMKRLLDGVAVKKQGS